MTKNELVPAFILHYRDYTDSRILVDLFTREQGRISSVLRVSRKKSSSGVRPQAFTPYAVSYSGKYELKTLTHYESSGSQLVVGGTPLFCGIYVNELMQRLLAVADPHPRLFDGYATCIARLASIDAGMEDTVLRQFEFLLLQELGYAFSFTEDAYGAAIIAHDSHYYRFDCEQGFVPERAGSSQSSRRVYSGSVIATIAENNWRDKSARVAAKKITRIALANLLGNKPLVSRELFT